MARLPEVPETVLSAYGLGRASIETLGGGRTNRTLRARAGNDLVLQHLDAGGHPNLLGVMENLVRVASHLDWKSRVNQPATRETWWPELVPTDAGKPFLMTAEGDVWRAFRYRDGRIAWPSLPRRVITSAAGLFGRFTEATIDIVDPPLEVTNPGFHDLGRVESALADAVDSAEGAARVQVESVLEDHAGFRDRLDRLMAADGLDQVPHRVVHNDTKLSNALIDPVEPRAIAVLDLDLVMPGPVWHDVGDLLRSAAWHGPTPEAPVFETEVAAAAIESYIDAAPSLTDAEIVTFAVAGARLGWELGVRYLTDHLTADVVLRVDKPDSHLRRGCINVGLATEMLNAYDALRSVVDDLIAARRTP